jgi:tyrosyl-tRNA synthetase
MMGKDSVKSRLESENGISYTEFSYMLLQAFDFVELNKQHNCRLQVGGNDQYGNITAGTELQRKLGRPPIYGLTAPLLLDSTGQKMGKTSTGERIWLSPERTRPFSFYQYWFNVTDEDAPRFLRWFSLRPLAELDELIAAHDQDRAKRMAQRELARAMTSWVHGDEAVRNVEWANGVFTTGTLDGLSSDDLTKFAATIPTVDIPRAELTDAIGIIDLFARAFESSKGDARTKVTQGGAYVNNVRIEDVKHTVTLQQFAEQRLLLVRRGKKDYKLVRAV